MITVLMMVTMMPTMTGDLLMKRCSCSDDGDETTMIVLVLGCVVVMISTWVTAGAARIAVRIARLMSQSQSDEGSTDSKPCLCRSRRSIRCFLLRCVRTGLWV